MGNQQACYLLPRVLHHQDYVHDDYDDKDYVDEDDVGDFVRDDYIDDGSNQDTISRVTFQASY